MSTLMNQILGEWIIRLTTTEGLAGNYALRYSCHCARAPSKLTHWNQDIKSPGHLAVHEKFKSHLNFAGKSIRRSMHQNSSRLCSNDHILVKIIYHKIQYVFPSILNFTFCIGSSGDGRIGGRKWGYLAIKLYLSAEGWKWEETSYNFI